jgi:hypothetical protein
MEVLCKRRGVFILMFFFFSLYIYLYLYLNAVAVNAYARNLAGIRANQAQTPAGLRF